MSIFKKLFKTHSSKEEKREPDVENENLSLDQVFVNHFIQNKGKFLYCTSLHEVVENVKDILDENNWKSLICTDNDLQKLLKNNHIDFSQKLSNVYPFFTTCEHLIAENGSILFSSNQLSDYKLSALSENFIVYATTSQLVKTKGESLTGIKSHYKGNIPSNISPIKNYDINIEKDDFMSYGNTNSKNLYLLLFEDL